LLTSDGCSLFLQLLHLPDELLADFDPIGYGFSVSSKDRMKDLLALR